MYIICLFITLKTEIIFGQPKIKYNLYFKWPLIKWSFLYPLKVKKTIRTVKKTLNEVENVKNDSITDNDNNGGQLDAFKHAYFMALLTKNIGFKPAKKFGIAYEITNYKTYKKSKKKNNNLNYYDYKSCLMDYLNNNVGLTIGITYKNLNEDDIKKVVLDYLFSGKLYILLKDDYNNFLDCNNCIIDISKNDWFTNKCLVPSNQKKL